VAGQPLLVFGPSDLSGIVLPSTGVESSSLDDDIAFTVLAVAGSAIAWDSRKLFALTSIVTVVAIGLRWAMWWKPTHTLVLWSVSSTLASALSITAVLFRQVLGPGQVTMTRIRGAIAAYLCIGWSWANAFHLAALLNRGAFSSTGSDLSHGRTWLNYSLGMLSTAGYGGIVAVSPLAHTLGSAEAVTGQLYLAVLVARLVSMQVSDD
jgi:hypothetical protein